MTVATVAGALAVRPGCGMNAYSYVIKLYPLATSPFSGKAKRVRMEPDLPPRALAVGSPA